MPEPPISVVMPVHNGMPFLQRSIESILDQTVTQFEFIILDDGSTDDSQRVLRQWEQKDRRIRVYRSNQQLGLVGSSNFVVAKARASIIARMDADDLCEPARLERQWQVMRDHPDVTVVGALCDGIDAAGQCVRSRDRWRIIRRSNFPPFPHGSVMFRRPVFEEVGGYRKDAVKREDQDLFRRMAARGRVVTLPEILYHYRYHLQNASLKDNSPACASEQLSTLHSLGAMRLWAGHPPAILRAVIEDESQKWTAQWLKIVTWAAWGSLHPRSLRSLCRGIVQMRDLIASVRVTEGRFYEWRFE